MAFTFKGVDVEAKLGDPLIANDSLFGLLFRHCKPLMAELVKTWTDFRGDKKAKEYGLVEKPFADVEGWWGTKYGDNQVMGALFAASQEETRAVVGYGDMESFMTRFESARENAFYVFFQFLSVQQLMGLSFKATYLHKDVEHVFLQHKHGTDVKVLSSRVTETAKIMLRILWGNMNGPWRLAYNTRTLVTTFLLAVMHNRMLRNDDYKRSGRYCYNQSSVAFTLLTFAYLVADVWEKRGDRFPLAYCYKEDDWYFFWKVLGSALGVSAQLMPDNHQEAETLWNTFKQSDECHRSFFTVNGGLIDAFEDAEVKPLDLLQWVPSYVVTQLRHLGSWTIEPALDRLFVADLMEAIASGDVRY